MSEEKTEISDIIIKIIGEMILNSFSGVFFMTKPFLYSNCSESRNELAKEIIMNRMRDVCYNAAAKLEKFSQLLSQIRNDEKISTMILG